MNRLKELRIKKGITQARLASELGTSQQNLSRIERGTAILPSDLAVNASRYFCVTLDYLLGESEQRYDQQFIHRMKQYIVDYEGLLEDLTTLTPEHQILIRDMVHALLQQQIQEKDGTDVSQN